MGKFAVIDTEAVHIMKVITSSLMQKDEFEIMCLLQHRLKDYTPL